MMIDPEDQVAADIAAAEARGEDPYADKATPQAPVVEEVIAVETEEVPEPIEGVQVAEEVEPDTEPVAFKTEMPSDYKDQRNVLVKEKAVIMKKLMDGEMDADEFALEESRISDALEDLTATRIRAETLHEANMQTQATHQQRAIQSLIANTKAEIDYTGDAKAQRQFDTALNLVGQDPDNAGKPYGELIGEAHKVVMALRGVTRAPVVDKAPRPKRQGEQPPQTLSGLPTAASNSAKTVERALAELSGDELERAFNALPKGEFERLLKA